MTGHAVGASAGGVASSVSIADGDAVTIGAKADPKSTATDTTAISVVSILKQISASVQAPPAVSGTVAATQSGTWTVQPGNTANTTAWKVDNSAVTQPVSGTFWQATQPVSSTTLATAAKQPALGTAGTSASDVISVQGIASGTALPVSGTFWQTTQPTSIADGGDVTLGAKTDAKSTATDATSITVMQVLKQISASSQAPPSTAVTNAGTFAVQATLQTQTDTVMVGGVNVKEINGVAPLMGNGASGTGAQRVSIANDSTGILALTTSVAEIGNVKNSGTFAVQAGHGKTCKTITGAASATFTAVAAVASKRIKVYSLSMTMTSTTAVTITFKDGAAGTAIATYLMQAPAANSVFGIVEPGVTIPGFIFATTAATLLEMSFSAAVSVTYNLRYFDDDAA